VWEELLTSGVERLLGVKRGFEMRRFAGVATTRLNATELHDFPEGEVPS